MAEKIVQLSTSQISKDVADFTVGLVKLIERERVEDAVCAGSGTLATIGKVHGILTAAHVIDQLPNAGEVGIVLYHEMTFQKQVLRMEDKGSPCVQKYLVLKDPTSDFYGFPRRTLDG